LEHAYQRYFEAPAINVVPTKVNTRVQDLIDAVDRRYGAGGGTTRLAVVSPDGTIALPEIASIPAQGLTVAELDVEINARYRDKLGGVVVNAVLVQRAHRYIYVMGEMQQTGRFELLAPTTLSQAISLGGNWNVGANLRHIIVIRRSENWQTIGCVVNMQDVLYYHKPCPQNDIWLCDSDVVIVPKGEVLQADDWVELLFTRGLYRVFPLGTTLNFNKQATL
jgi:polysaccharide export outer membrane protein